MYINFFENSIKTCCRYIRKRYLTKMLLLIAFDLSYRADSSFITLITNTMPDHVYSDVSGRFRTMTIPKLHTR